jgi:hypothetical protein
MQSWGFWEWLTYSSIGVAAVILAADAALKGSPDVARSMSGLLSNRIWGFAPLALISLSAVLILAAHFGLIGIRAPAETDQAVPNAEVSLRFTGDMRAPERLSFNNVYRWYYLRNMIVMIDKNTGQETTRSIGNLFLTFEKPVIVSTLTITSPDMTLPTYEVKDFNARSAVISFSGEMPAGTLVVRVQQ